MASQSSVIASIMAFVSRRLPRRIECAAEHKKYWIVPWTYIVCFECHHPYTKRKLVNDDFAVRQASWLALLDFEPLEPKPVEKYKAEEIFCCPCCAHDF